MKNFMLSLLLASLTLASIHAQEKYLSVSGGYTAPLAEFSSTDLSNKESGFAKSGYNFSFEMSFFLNDFFGIGANLRFNNCDFNSELFNDLLRDKFQGQLDSISLTSGNYNLHNFLFGPYLKLDIGNFISIYGKTFLGVMTIYRPGQSLSYKLPFENSQSLETAEKYTGTFAYNIGAGAFVKFNGKIGIRLSVDYIAGKPKYDDFDYEKFELTQKKQAVAYLNYNAGLMLVF